MVQQRGARAEPLFNQTIFFQLRNPEQKKHQMRMPLPAPLLKNLLQVSLQPKMISSLGNFFLWCPHHDTWRNYETFFFFSLWGLAESTNKSLGTISTELMIFLIFLQSSGTTQKAEGHQQIQKHSEKSFFSSIWIAPGYPVNKVHCSESF